MKYYAFILLISLLLYSPFATAADLALHPEITTLSCNPKEDCRVCVFRSPITGKCVQHGNDYTCETRKAICNGKVKACVISVIGAKVFTGYCASCIVGAWATGGAALLACAVPCGLAADQIQKVIDHCR
jgi:hypothetical protein